MPDRPATDSTPADLPRTTAAEAEQRGSFLGFVAHEMRNPLSTALWSAELLARLSPEDRAGARGDKLAGMCLRSLQRLRLLVEDHFLAERLEVAGIPLRLEAVPLRDALEEAARKVGAVQLTMEIDDGIAVWSDRGLAERALESLLAVAGRNKAPVHVEATRTGEEAVVRVRGAPPEPDALQPPQKGTASDPSGRALALHMTSRVARAVGGELSIAGDQYVLSVPLAPERGAPETTA